MDNFKFITNIANPCGGGPTLEEYVEKVLKQAAGVAAPEKSDSKESDKEKGQVISDKGEAGEGHQDGESVKGKSDADKKAAVKPARKTAAGKAKPEDGPGEAIPISLDADEEFQKGESVDASKVTPKNKKTEAKAKPAVKKAEKTKCEKCKCDPCECEKKASTSKWTKISNLNPKEKKMLRSFWLTQYPRDYVDAMVQDR